MEKYCKEVVSDWNIFAENGLKLPRQKKFLRIFFFICSFLRYRLNVFLPQLVKVECPNFLEIQNLLGKVLEKIGLRYEHVCSKMV